MFAWIFLSPFVAFAIWQFRGINPERGWWALLIGTILLGFTQGNLPDNCHADWDGRSNAVYCD